MSLQPPSEPLAGWERPDRGVLFVVSGPSGVGKSTLLQAALARIPGLSFSISATTRSPRPGEREGVDYFFVTREQFEQQASEGAFLEHATVYDQRYGTPKAPVTEALAKGDCILLDIDVQGARQVRTQMPDAVHIFLLPRSMSVLEGRLRNRGDDESVIVRRMAQAHHQLLWSATYDYVVVNDDLQTAHATLQGILLAETSRVERRGSALDRVFSGA